MKRIDNSKVISVIFSLLFLFMLLPFSSYAGINDELIDAARKGDINRIKKLLDKGADVNAKDKDGETALMAAALRGHTEIVQFLLNKGADVNAKRNDGTTALMAAAREGHTETVRILKQAGGK